MRQTTNFGLNLFDGSDKVQYSKLNENAEKIDGALREMTPAIGDIQFSFNNLEEETGGKLLALDGRVIDVVNDYPGLADRYDLNHRLADAEEELAAASATGSVTVDLYDVRGVRLDGNYFFLADSASGSDTNANYLFVLKADGSKSKLLTHTVWVGESAGQIVALWYYDSVFKAYVFDSDGAQVREVQLNSSAVTLRDVRVLESGRLLIVSSKGMGWYTDDNFATHGACTWDGATAAGTIPAGMFYGDVGRTIYELDGAVYVLVKTTTTTTDTTGFAHEADTLTAWRSADGGGTFVKQWEFTPEERESAVSGPTDRSILAVVPHDGAFVVVAKYALPYAAGASQDSAGNYVTTCLFDNLCENRRINGETGETLLTKEYQGGCGAGAKFVRNGALHLAGSYTTSISVLSGVAAASSAASATVSVKMDLATLEMEETPLISALGDSFTNYIYIEEADSLMKFGGTTIRAINLETGRYLDLNGPQTEAEEAAGIPFLPDGEGKVYYPWSDGLGAIAAIDLSKRKLYEVDFGYVNAKA